MLTWAVAAFVGSFAAVVRGGETRDVNAVDVLHCTFGEGWDVNYDGWPDRWIRHTGPDYPHYVSMELVEDATAPDGKCLRIGLDGAAAALASPPIRVMSRFSYLLEAKLKNENLQRSVVVFTLDFYDDAGHLLQSEESDPIATTQGWEQVRLGPIEPIDPAVARAVIGVNVMRGSKGDLQGRVSLGDVWLGRRPRISVKTNNPSNVYTGLGDVVVKCESSGIRERDPEIRFQLIRGEDELVDTYSVRLGGRLIAEDVSGDASVSQDATEATASYEGSAEWRPHIPDYGYYRVEVKMLSSEADSETADEGRELDRRTVWLAVAPPLDMPKRGEFGWSLPTADDPLSLDQLAQLLPQVGVNWVKLPVWYDASNPRRGDELIRFVEMLSTSNIEVVGVIDQPPAGTDLAARSDPKTSIADVLAPEAAVWSASLEPVMTRLSLRVRWWQLGRDYDIGFGGYPDLNQRIRALRSALFRFGQDVRLGFCWDWEGETQMQGAVSWDFQQDCLSTPPSLDELESLLRTKSDNSAQRWILVEPPPIARTDEAAESASRNRRDQHRRFREFVLKLVSAKEHGASAIFVPQPFNDENGLMRAEGMPAELLLPWRTTAAMLGGANYLGRLQLPNGSENRVFLRPDGQVVMIVWNDKPTQEAIYLGKELRCFDLLGRTTTVLRDDEEQVIEVGPLPTFVVGLHEAIARWRMAVDFERFHLPSIFAKPQSNALEFHNHFPQGVGGSSAIVVLNEQHQEELQEKSTAAGSSAAEPAAEPATFAPGLIPDRWTIEPERATFSLAAGEDAHLPFEIRLRNALYGRQPIRVDFDLEADQRYRFSVYRNMEVGTGDLTLEVKTHLDEDGTLIVEQYMTNSAESTADFKCYLYGGPRRKRMQVYRLGPAVDRKVYRYRNGRELIGKEMLLELEELNGQRVLRHRFVATATTEDDEPDFTPLGPPAVDSGGADEATTPTATGIGS